MKNLIFLILSATWLISCNGTGKIFSENKTPHEVYAKKIEDRPSGEQWLAVSKKVLETPQLIQLPYNLKGQFPAGKPRALAFVFTARRGERVNFNLVKKVSGTVIYADLFKVNGDLEEHLLAAEIENPLFGFDVNETGQYILRVQPELEIVMGYTLSITVAPSLGFPVAGSKARVGGVWGDSRDNGKRSHEGIDIFAAKLTPVIAAADGIITSVKDGGLGGKTIHLKVTGRNLSLYYAHLDQQLVEEGQLVKGGDTLGLVGNTGNAITTSPHLHFGIYAYGGAIDPLPFVNKSVNAALSPVTKELTGRLQLIKPLKTKKNETLAITTALIPLAVTKDNYIAELPGGELILLPLKSVKAVQEIQFHAKGAKEIHAKNTMPR